MKRLIAALTIGGVVSAGVFASAAGLTVTPNTLGAGQSGVSSCDGNGVSTTYATTYDSTDKRFELDSISVAGVHYHASNAGTCRDKVLTLQVAKSDGTTLKQLTWTVSGDTKTWTAADDALTNIDAADVGHVAVVING